MNSDELRASVLSLPPHDRAKLAKDLLQSLDAETDPEVEVAWLDEILRRAQDVSNGNVETVDWADARERIQKRLRERRA